MSYKRIKGSRQIRNYLAGHVPPNRKLFCGTVPPNRKLFGGTVLPNRKLFGGTVPPNRKLFGGTVPPNSLPQKKLLMVQQIKQAESAGLDQRSAGTLYSIK